MVVIGRKVGGTKGEAAIQVQRVAKTLACVHALYTPNVEGASELLSQIRLALYNNAARLRAYSHASTLLSGTVLRTARGCDPAITGMTR